MDNPFKLVGKQLDELVQKVGDRVETRLRRRVVRDNLAVLVELDPDRAEDYQRMLDSMKG